MLMPDRSIRAWDITRKMTTVCEPGQFAVHVATAGTTGSGAAIGETWGHVEIESANNGAVSGSKFAGVTEHYHVSLDTTKYDLNEFKGEHLINKVCTLMTEGYVVTDQISGTPTIGAPAYLCLGGKVSPTDIGLAPLVGKFDTVKDENGYAKVHFSTLS